MRTVVLIALFVAGPAAAKTVVVTTTQDPAAMARAIGGDRVDVTALAKGFQDPHFLDAKPSYMLQLHKADLVVVIGLELEAGYLAALLHGARNQDVLPGNKGYLDLSAAIEPLEAHLHGDRSQGDIHPAGNPHYWLDPENGRRMARAIADRLSALDPEGAATYQRNRARFDAELARQIAEWKRRLLPAAQRPIITYHRSWSYFVHRFGFEVVGFIEPKPGVPPTPMHTLELIKTAQAKRVPFILMESFYDRRVPELVADKSGARVVSVPNSVGGKDGLDTYAELFETIVGAIERAVVASP